MERTLITGGAGFLGSHLCDFFIAQGHEVICMDNLIKKENIENIAHLIGHERFEFIKYDVTEYLSPLLRHSLVEGRGKREGRSILRGSEYPDLNSFFQNGFRRLKSQKNFKEILFSFGETEPKPFDPLCVE